MGARVKLKNYAGREVKLRDSSGLNRMDGIDKKAEGSLSPPLRAIGPYKVGSRGELQLGGLDWSCYSKSN